MFFFAFLFLFEEKCQNVNTNLPLLIEVNNVINSKNERSQLPLPIWLSYASLWIILRKRFRASSVLSNLNVRISAVLMTFRMNESSYIKSMKTWLTFNCFDSTSDESWLKRRRPLTGLLCTVRGHCLSIFREWYCKLSGGMTGGSSIPTALTPELGGRIVINGKFEAKCGVTEAALAATFNGSLYPFGCSSITFGNAFGWFELFFESRFLFKLILWLSPLLLFPLILMLVS